MQIVVIDVEDPLSVWRNQIRFSDHPLFWYLPIKNARATGDLDSFKRNQLAENVVGLPDAIARDTPQNWPQTVEVDPNLIRGHQLRLFPTTSASTTPAEQRK